MSACSSILFSRPAAAAHLEKRIRLKSTRLLGTSLVFYEEKIIQSVEDCIFFVLLFRCFSSRNREKVFDLMDANQDGKVTKEEFMAFYMEHAQKTRDARFDRLDTNGDGKITRKGFMAVRLNEAEKIGKFRFNRIDADGDGIIPKKS
jgi:hypothetical protein